MNDEGELGNGMYLAAACQNFISWQNSFIQSILDADNDNNYEILLSCNEYSNSSQTDILYKYDLEKDEFKILVSYP